MLRESIIDVYSGNQVALNKKSFISKYNGVISEPIDKYCSFFKVRLANPFSNSDSNHHIFSF